MYGMKVCVVTDGGGRLPECDLALFGFNRLGEVDYESELSGRSDKFEEAARLSRAASCGVVCACKTVSRGVRRKSAAVADRGKLLGIADMNHVFGGEEYKSGACLGLYSVGGYKVGVCIENDLYFPEGVRALSALRLQRDSRGDGRTYGLYAAPFNQGICLPLRRARGDVRGQNGVLCRNFRRGGGLEPTRQPVRNRPQKLLPPCGHARARHCRGRQGGLLTAPCRLRCRAKREA